MSTVELEIVRLRGHVAGKIVTCAVDADGVIIDRFWRRRLRDSSRDGCVKLVAAVPVAVETAGKQRKKNEVTDNGNSNS